MNTGSQMPERAFAGVRRPELIDTTDGCALSLPLGGRQAFFVGGIAGGVWFAQAGSLQFNAMRTMNDAVQDRIADRRISHQYVFRRIPAGHSDASQPVIPTCEIACSDWARNGGRGWALAQSWCKRRLYSGCESVTEMTHRGVINLGRKNQTCAICVGRLRGFNRNRSDHDTGQSKGKFLLLSGLPTTVAQSSQPL